MRFYVSLASGEEILRIPSRSALNIPCSLLPRYRGPNPLLWIYYHNDQCTGVTVHYMNQRADAGDILAQEAFDLHRGFALNRRPEPMQGTRKKGFVIARCSDKRRRIASLRPAK